MQATFPIRAFSTGALLARLRTLENHRMNTLNLHDRCTIGIERTNIRTELTSRGVAPERGR